MRPTILCIALAALLATSIPARAETLVLATGEWPPYSSAAMDDQGVFPAILAMVFTEMGVDHEIRFYPWKRCYQMVRDGEIWGAFPYSRTQRRLQEVLYSDSVAYSTTVFFTYGNKPAIQYKDLADLAPWHIGGISGYFYEEQFDKAGLRVTYVPDERSALQMLVAGRVDLVPVNELVGWHLIREMFPGQGERFHVLERPLSHNELSVIVSPDRPGSQRMLERFNRALAKVLASGASRAILESHGLR